MGMSVDQRGFASANTAVGNTRDYLDNKQLPSFVVGKVMILCGCYACDNWWTQPHGFQLAVTEGRQQGATL
jgi:hypothetical protein